MRIPYYFGWILLAVAFVSAAAEVLVRSTGRSSELIVAAHDLLYAISPSGLLIIQIRLENISPYLWDPWILMLLGMPAWVLFGGPGFLLIIVFRPRKPDYMKRLEEARQQERQLLLYDELAREAELKGIDRNEDDMRPDHSGHEVFLRGDQSHSELDHEVSRRIREMGEKHK